jgi:moderate conductance mechanosensitive channel
VAVSVLVPAVSFRDPGQAQAATLIGACGRAPGMACRLTWDLTHSSYAADFASAYLAGPVRLALRIALVLVLAALVRSAAQRLIRRVTARAAINRDGPDRPHAMFGGRRSQRATALASVLGNAASVAIFSVAALIILGDMGVNLAPILASAGVLGIALGFGAQSLVQDYLAGIFILLEDQYGVGDVIEVSGVCGTVEAVSLRITRVRDVNGVAWHIRNGTIQQAGNETHGWARAVVDFPVPYGTPVATARAALEHAVAGMYAESRWNGALLEEPEVWGVETVAPDTLLIRVAAKTRPLARSEVARELRERLKNALDAATLQASGSELAGPPTALAAADPALSADAGQAGPGQPDPATADPAKASPRSSAAKTGTAKTGTAKTGTAKTGTARTSGPKARAGHGAPAAAKPARATLRRRAAAADAAAGGAGAGTGTGTGRARKSWSRRTAAEPVAVEPGPAGPPDEDPPEQGPPEQDPPA